MVIPVSTFVRQGVYPTPSLRKFPPEAPAIPPQMKARSPVHTDEAAVHALLERRT